MAERETNLRDIIKKSIEHLKKYFEIKEAILFGSQLTGKASRYSDIDLVVISPDFRGKSYEEILNIFAELAIRYSSRIELHPYTEDDLKNARPTNFLGYLLKTGKVVFKSNKLVI